MCLFALHTQAALIVVENGASPYRIVVATNAIASEKHAAEEFRHYIEKITGVSLPITKKESSGNQHEIVIGGDAAGPFESGALNKLGSDGFLLKTQGGRLIIAGGKTRGTLNGVYTFLEEKLGIRWFTPELEVVPTTNRLQLSEINESFVPPLEYRETSWTELTRNADFTARQRLNGAGYDLGEKHGGRFAVYFPFVHSMDSLIPRELYQQHPEYFPLINGKRVNGYVQRCLSNPDVLKLAKATVRQWIKEHPEATIISVSQNDTANWCQCDQCKTLDEQEGSPSATLLRFVNAIAADIASDYPNIRIDTLAYQYTRKPPRTIRPRSNVIIRLCSIECCFAHPLGTCDSEENQLFRRDVEAWQPIAPTLYIWDYTPNFAHYQQPFPNFDVLQPNIEFFIQHSVKGIYEEGNYSPGGFGEMGPLRAYLLAKALWNPNTDLLRHRNEFIAAYYEDAAPEIREYVQLLQNQVREPNRHARIYDPPTAAYLNNDFLANADKLFQATEAKAKTDVVRQRVQIAHLPIWYVQIATGRVRDEARKQLIHQFLEVARKAGISQIAEGRSLETWAANVNK